MKKIIQLLQIIAIIFISNVAIGQEFYGGRTLFGYTLLDAPKVFTSEGQAYLDSVDFNYCCANDKERIYFLTKAILIEPNNAELYSSRGQSYCPAISDELYDNAIKDFTKAIEINPKDPFYYYQRAETYHLQGEKEKAINDLSQAIRIIPNDVKLFIMRARYYSRSGNNIAAIRDMQSAIKLEPNNLWHYHNKAYYKSLVEDYYGALEDYKRALELETDTCSIYNHIEGMATSYYYLGNYKIASDYFSKVISFLSNTKCSKNYLTGELTLISSYYYRGECRLELNDLETSFEDFKSVIKIGKGGYYVQNSYGGIINIGMAYIKLDKQEKACQTFSKAGELGSDKAYEYIKRNCN